MKMVNHNNQQLITKMQFMKAN